MSNITLNLPKEVKQELEKDLGKIKTLTKKPKEFHIKKAVVRYLEHADKLVKRYDKELKKGGKNHTNKDLLERLNLKEVEE